MFAGARGALGLDNVLKNELRERITDLKPKLVAEFKELTDQDVDEAGTTPTRSSTRFSRRPASRASRSSSE